MKVFHYNEAAATQRIIAPAVEKRRAQDEYVMRSVRNILDATARPITAKDICAAHTILCGNVNLNPDNVVAALREMGDEVALAVSTRDSDPCYAWTRNISRKLYIEEGAEVAPGAEYSDVPAGDPGSRVIETRHFAKFHWPSLAVGDEVEGVGKISTPLLCQLISEQMPKSLAEALASLPKSSSRP